MDFRHQVGRENHQSGGPASCHGHAGSVFVPSIGTASPAKVAGVWPLARHDGIAHSAMIYIPEGAKRPRGRPHMRWWRDVIPKDIEELGFPKPSAEEAFMWAQSREDWRLICSTLANTDYVVYILCVCVCMYGSVNYDYDYDYD